MMFGKPRCQFGHELNMPSTSHRSISTQNAIEYGMISSFSVDRWATPISSAANRSDEAYAVDSASGCTSRAWIALTGDKDRLPAAAVVSRVTASASVTSIRAADLIRCKAATATGLVAATVAVAPVDVGSVAALARAPTVSASTTAASTAASGQRTEATATSAATSATAPDLSVGVS
jgi:hypothetical protein